MRVPYVPVNAWPTVPPLTPETDKLELASASVSLDKTPLPAFTDSVASSLTAPASLLPTGSSSTPVTVIVIVAVSCKFGVPSS